jgi:endonuclease-3
LKSFKTSFSDIFSKIEALAQSFTLPSVSLLAKEGANPFQILLATLISLRTKDALTLSLSRKLFERVRSPQDVLGLGTDLMEEALYPCAFYKRKTQQTVNIARLLIQENNSEVPDSLDALLKLPGVGIKTANLVLALSYGQNKICVDIHVHRIANRLGWIRTRTPEQTEQALMRSVPQEYWGRINEALVNFGIYQCTPVSPKCSSCPAAEICPRFGVEKNR